MLLFTLELTTKKADDHFTLEKALSSLPSLTSIDSDYPTWVQEVLYSNRQLPEGNLVSTWKRS
jgi:hypothetical protein